MKLFFNTIILLSFLSANQVFANWKKVEKVDDFTDKKTSYALYYGPDHDLELSWQKDKIWMFIKRKKIGSFEPNTEIELRVDKNKTLTINPATCLMLEKYIGKAYQWTPGVVGFMIWNNNTKNNCGFLGEILNGNQLKIRYYTSPLERESFSVDLSGSKRAILDGLNLDDICSGNDNNRSDSTEPWP